MVTISIRHIKQEDASTWATLRHDLWSEASIAEHAMEIAEFFAGKLDEPLAALVACETVRDEIIGLAELSIRREVPGCRTNRVGFVEGLYVLPAWRHRGIGRQLLRATRTWAKQNGCTEFASDRPHGFVLDRRFGGIA
jgi:aminoglycoside 6'-N-acetyltransferase I